ncbi:MAG: hypothetical protein HRT58_14695 [Crocinitomicaceae bacterium]|nr:hypothetical protein [Flavobacteriales bacterium]NQZ36916.1 hypothetical protein [Crocinitomicaceae bacterium]
MSDINPYVRLTKKTIDTKTKYTLEVMLPIEGTNASDAGVTIDHNGPVIIKPGEDLPFGADYAVHLITSNTSSPDKYVLVKVDLSPIPSSNKIIVSVFSSPKLLRGPETSGKTIIQFEDAIDE